MSDHPRESGLWLGFWPDWMDGQHQALEAGGYPTDYFADDAEESPLPESTEDDSENEQGR